MDPNRARLLEDHDYRVAVARDGILAAGRTAAWAEFLLDLCECPVTTGGFGLHASALAEMDLTDHAGYCPSAKANAWWDRVRTSIEIDTALP